MKIKPGFKIRKVGKEYIINAEGKDQINFNKILALNETAKFLWDNMDGNSFDIEKLTNLLVEEYDIPLEDANKDASDLITELIRLEVIE